MVRNQSISQEWKTEVESNGNPIHHGIIRDSGKNTFMIGQSRSMVWTKFDPMDNNQCVQEFIINDTGRLFSIRTNPLPSIKSLITLEI
jgi:hypothetical protein